MLSTLFVVTVGGFQKEAETFHLSNLLISKQSTTFAICFRNSLSIEMAC